MAIKLQPDKDRDNYLKQIYGGSPPSMDYYRQLGAQKRANEEAAKAARQAQAEAKSAAKKAETEAKKAKEKAEKEAKKAKEKADKEAEKKKKDQELYDLLTGFNQNSAPPTSGVKAESTTKKSSGGFLNSLKDMGKAYVSNAKQGVQAIADLLNPTVSKKEAATNVAKRYTESVAKNPQGQRNVMNLSESTQSGLTMGGLGDKTKMNNTALNVTGEILGSLVPGTAAVKGARAIGLGAKGISNVSRAKRAEELVKQGMSRTDIRRQLTKETMKKAGQLGKEGAAAGLLYTAGEEGINLAREGRNYDPVQGMKNLAFNTTVGAVADPLFSELFSLAGAGARRAVGNRGLSELPPMPQATQTREPVSNILQPDPANVRNVLNRAPVPDISLGNTYRHTPTVTRPEFNINTRNIPDLQTRVNQLDTLVPQRAQLDTNLNQSRNAFLDDFVEQYRSTMPSNQKEVSDGLMQWDMIKKQRDDYDNIRKQIDKFYIPKEFAEEYKGLFPRSFLLSSDKAGMDVFSAAQAFGFSGDHEGVLQFGQMLRALQEAKTVKKMDIVPKETGTLTANDVEGLRKVGDAAFTETQDYQAVKPLLDAFDTDIKNLKNPNIVENLNIQANAKAPDDPLAALAGLRGQNTPPPPPPPKTPKTDGPAPSRKPKPTDGKMESPVAHREERTFLEKMRDMPGKVKKGYARAKYEMVSMFQPAKELDRIAAKMDTQRRLKRTPHGDIDVSDSFHKNLRATSRTSRIAAESVDKNYVPIIRELHEAGIGIEPFNDYAVAKHAKDILENNAEKAQKAKKLVEDLQKTAIGSDEAKAIEKQLEDFEQYLLPPEASKEWVEQTLKKWEGNKAMEKGHKAFIKEQQKDLIMLHKAGRYSKAQIDAMMKEHPNYVSLRRDVENPKGNRGKGSTARRVGEPFKERKSGSSVKILPPLESALQSRIRSVDTVLKNKALQKLEKLFTVEGMENFIRPIKKSDPYFDPDNAVRFFKDGQEHWYEVSDEIAHMLNNLGSGTDSLSMKWLESLAVFSKKGMTHYNPKFLVKAPIRDTQNAIFTSRSGVSPVDVIGGFLDAMAGEKISKLTGGRFKSYNEVFKEMGGDFSSYISMDINDIAKVQKTMQTGEVGKGFELLNPFKGAEKFGATMERAPRLAEFRSAKRKGYSDEGALFEATDVIDYQDLGATIAKLNRVAPYLGATIRGNIRVLQAFKENPAKAIGRGITSITLPTVALYSLRFNDTVSDDQRAKIQNMPDWQKNLYWAVPDISPDSEKVYLIPKGFLVNQIFSNPVERALDHVYTSDKTTAEKFAKATMKDFATAIIPPTAIAGVSTIMQVARNQDDFLGMPIESEEMKKKDARDRYDASTSELAKVIGKMTGLIGLSPAKVDYLIKGNTGTLGKDALDLSDNLVRGLGVERPAKTRTNAEILNPFDQFTYNTTGSSRYSEELYQADQKEASHKADIRAEFKDRTGMTMPNDERGRSEVGQYYDLFRDINKEVKAIREDMNLSAAEKRDRISSLRDEQRALGVKLTEQGVLTNQDRAMQDTESYFAERGKDAKPTKGDISDVLRTQLLNRGIDRQKVDALLRNIEKEQMIGLLEQLR